MVEYECDCANMSADKDFIRDRVIYLLKIRSILLFKLNNSCKYFYN